MMNLAMVLGNKARRYCVIIPVLLIFTVTQIQGSTNGFIIPAFRNSPGAKVGVWEIFKVAVGQPGNLPDQAGPSTTAVLTQLSTNAFLTGSGNLYNLSTSAFELTDSNPGPVATIVLQVRTVGTELDYNSVALNFTNASGLEQAKPLFRYESSRVSGPQGTSVATLWQWDLAGMEVTNYVISFAARGESLSFDSLSLDTAPQFQNAFVEQPFALHSIPADLARWMYPFNSNPTGRPTASVFGALGSSPDFDSRDAQYLLSWTTTNQVPASQGITNYLIKRARVTLTIASGNQYTYSGTLRDFRSYFPTNDPNYLNDSNRLHTVDLFGVSYRGEYNSTNWGVNPDGGYYTNRIAYAAGFNTNGLLVDVSNNVGDDGTNEISNPFEVAPFAVGQSTNVAKGELMPLGSQLTFEINLEDPLIYSYLQRGLNDGKLDFMATSFIAASFSGPPTYPNFYTIHSPIATPSQFPLLHIEGEIIRPGIDSDADGLPDDWENFYFGSLAENATSDTDSDGAGALVEFQTGTHPGNAAHLLGLTIQQETNRTEIQFPFAPGKEHLLQSSDSIDQWQRLSNAPITYSSAWLDKKATGLSYPSLTYAVGVDTNTTTGVRFYRVKVQ